MMECRATSAPLRLTRALVDRLPKRTDERGPIQFSDPAPDYHQRTAKDILSRLEQPDTLWIFAAGSLIWNPRCDVIERRAATTEGWQRAFCINDLRFRGCPAQPGLMMSLDRGGSCSGIALRMAPDDLLTSLVGLLEKEPPVPPEFVTAQTEDGPVQAIVFAIDPAWSLYRPEPDLGELADILASSVGYFGTMAEYLFNTITEMEEAGIHDPHLWRLQDMVAERLERLPVPQIGSPTDCAINAPLR